MTWGGLEKGSALMTVLLFSLAMTGLVVAALETDLLVRRMSDQDENKMMAFAAAEMGLLREEAAIQHTTLVVPPSDATIHTQRKLLAEDRCHQKRYEIISCAIYQQTVVNLRSIYAYLPDPEKKCVEEKINQRIFWALF